MTKNFLKANASSLAASAVDFGTLISLVEIFHLNYVAATAIGACLGAITNFSINEIWTFTDAQKRALHHAMWRYVLVSGMSAALNTSGVFFFAHFLHFQYVLAKLITALAVGWLWNYPLHRYFVWPKKESEKENTTHVHHSSV